MQTIHDREKVLTFLRAALSERKSISRSAYHDLSRRAYEQIFNDIRQGC